MFKAKLIKIKPIAETENPQINHKAQTKQNLLKKLIELSQSSSSHGFPNIFRTQRISIKLLWAVCFILSVAICSYMIFQTMNDYLDYNVVTTTEFISELVSEFPAVTICDSNPLSTKHAQDLTQKWIRNLISEDRTNLTRSNVFDYIFWSNRLALLEAVSFFFTDDDRKKLGDLIPNINKCYFNEEICSAENFSWYFDLNNGNCIQFNTGLSGNEIKESNKPGSRNGLSLIFFSSEPENKYSSSFTHGFKVYIHNRSLSPSPAEAINIQPSKSTDIAIKRTFIHKEPYPYSSCIHLSSFESIFYEYFKSVNKTYRQADCFELCLQNNIMKNCSCYDYSYPRINNSFSPCFTKPEILCTIYQYNYFRRFKMSEECLKLCPLECDSVKYDVSMSSLDFPSKFVFDIYKNFGLFNGTFESFKQNLLQVNIFYPSLTYTKISESPKMSITDLLSNLGGTLGLYIGISFLSLIEIVEMLIELLLTSFNR